MDNNKNGDLEGVISDIEKEKIDRLKAKRIKNEGFSLRRDYSILVLGNPWKHLMKCEEEKVIEEPFVKLHQNTSELIYMPIWIEYKGKKNYILAVSEIGELERKRKRLETWAITDNGLFLPISLQKDSTLFGPYIYNDDSYKELAPFTYSFHQLENIITPKDKPIVKNIGYTWIDYD